MRADAIEHRLRYLRALADRATPGPWRVTADAEICGADAALAAEARTAVPQLSDSLLWVARLHVPITQHADADECGHPATDDEEYTDRHPVGESGDPICLDTVVAQPRCTQCAIDTPDGLVREPWPCTTVLAIARKLDVDPPALWEPPEPHTAPPASAAGLLVIIDGEARTATTGRTPTTPITTEETR